MIIKKVYISGFRNIEKEEFLPDCGINIICGDNAQGKTNIIEAIWMFTGAKSFRGGKDKEIININKSLASTQAEFFSGEIKNTAKIEIEEKRTAFLNGKKLASPAELSERFSAIVFSPADISISCGAPSVRRKFLDTAVCQLYPKYIELLKSYNRAVIQRNNILKNCFKNASLKILLEDFEKEIVNNGEIITKYRRRYLKFLSDTAPKIYNELSGKKEILDIDYICSSGENLEKSLFLSRKEDMLRGITSVGPHRDDIYFSINGFSAREYASQGQKRSISLTVKLASAKIMQQIMGERPVALLDDVMSELDKERQNYILNHIKGWQVFITCCEDSHFEKLKNGKVFIIKNGGIT